MDKVVQGCGRGTQMCPPSLHPHLMKPGLSCYPLQLLSSSPFNLCHSHTVPFCPTSNPYSHFIPLTHPFSPFTLHSPIGHCGKTAISCHGIFGWLLSLYHVSADGVLHIPQSVLGISQPTVE